MMEENAMTENDKLQLFEDRPIRTAWDETQEEWYFSVMDVVAALTEQTEARKASTYWAVLKKRLKIEGASELLTNCKQLKTNHPRTENDTKRMLPTRNSSCASSSRCPPKRQNRSRCGWQWSAGSASRKPSTRN